MLISRKKNWEISDREVTPESLYLNRRAFLAAVGGATALTAMPTLAADPPVDPFMVSPSFTAKPIQGYEKLGPQDQITFPISVFTYNNFIEYGPDKTDHSQLSGNFKPRPWTVTVDGKCAKPGTFDLDDFLKPHGFEYRTYRLRCTETWSVVIPWVGIPLASVLKRYEPLGSAKFVRFETVTRPEEMPNQKTTYMKWPYAEALRLDEALSPLAFLAVGMYGQTLTNQNGAPVRLVVPWKYGFKSAKSIVRITFTEEQPATAWSVKIPKEYGFWANVNPKVDHPRWSQASERRIGEFLRRPTLMYNGYEQEVAHMYSGMDLVKNF